MLTEAIIYIVDDDQQARKAVQTLIQTMGVQSETFESAEEFLDAYDGHRPACLVTDVRMLGMSGLELQGRLNEMGLTMSVVVLTAFANTPTTVRAMRNGALTLIEKPCDENELWDAIRTGMEVDAQNYQRDRRRAEILQKLKLLTPKERQVLEFIVAGDANKVVARKLEVSIRTVENHRQKVFHKMKADSVAELVRIVLAAGITVETPA
jgi:two-component system response regulator FixJ